MPFGLELAHCGSAVIVLNASHDTTATAAGLRSTASATRAAHRVVVTIDRGVLSLTMPTRRSRKASIRLMPGTGAGTAIAPTARQPRSTA